MSKAWNNELKIIWASYSDIELAIPDGLFSAVPPNSQELSFFSSSSNLMLLICLLSHQFYKFTAFLFLLFISSISMVLFNVADHDGECHNFAFAYG